MTYAAMNEEPTLNVQAVEMRTGVTAETLRTWERRYGWPRPRRLPNGYRVYTEDDVAMILAVKREIEAGVSAAAAWQRVLVTARRGTPPETVQAPEQLTARLVAALLAFDGDAALALVAQAHAIIPFEQVLTRLMQPALVEIGNRWQMGEATIAQEHFASNVLRDNLVTISSAYRARPGAPAVLVGAAPGELHDIGPLMLAVLLRRHGVKVLYLGQNVALEQLAGSLGQLRPRMLVLAASRLETARHLLAVPPLIARLPAPQPLFAFGGRAFDGQHDLADRINGLYIAGDVVAAANRLEELLSGRNHL
ncbi:MAG TPA: B12-binding domain-containing protein [Chloroflexota bacterium]|nr:B12-binding domain-containing protein [Chloroflexota bacterium]